MQRPKPEKDMEISKDEYKKIERAMKKPEFMGLMNDYLLQISDPKNRAEYDQYMLQLQKQKELPKGMQLIRPQAQFCVKTTLISNMNKRHQMKIFINFCSCIELDKPTFAQSQQGQSWQLPHSVNKIRYDQDAKGVVVNTADVAFHPQAMQLCAMQAFQKMVIQAGIEGVSKQLGERKESLSLDYVVMKNLKCKGGEPALMPIRFTDGGTVLKTGEVEDERGREGRQTKLQKDINKQKEETKKQLQKEKAQQTPVFDQIQNEAPIQQGVQRPRYKTIYSYPVQYQDFIEERYKQLKYPNYLNIDFQVPRVQTVKELQFEMNEEFIRLQAEQKYFIELKFDQLKLKYKLLHGKAKSKFDKKKKKLRLIIPVDLEALPKHVPPPQPKMPEEDQLQENTQNSQHLKQKEQVKQKEQSVIQKDKQNKEETKPQEQEEKKDKDKDKLQAGQQTTSKKEQQFQQQKLWHSTNKLLQINEPLNYQAIVKQQQIKQLPKRALIEQLDEDDQTEKAAAPSPPPKRQPVPPKQKSFRTVPYHFQETAQKAMLVINLPKYESSLVDCMLDESHLFFEYRQEDPVFLLLKINKGYNIKESRPTLIKDFVVVNLIKLQKGVFWEKQAVEKQEVSRDEFLEERDKARLHFQALEEEKRVRAQLEVQEREKAEERLRQQQEARDQEKFARIEEMKKKLQAEGSGKDYGAHFIDFRGVQVLWELD